MAYENIDLSKAGPLGQDAYQRVDETLNAIREADQLANFLLHTNEATRYTPGASAMVQDIQSLLTSTYTSYRIDDAAWKTYVYESRGDTANAQAEYGVVVNQTNALKAKLAEYLAKAPAYEAKAYADGAAAAAEAAALEAYNQAQAEAAYQAYLQSQADAAEKERLKEIARQQKAAADAAAAQAAAEAALAEKIAKDKAAADAAAAQAAEKAKNAASVVIAETDQKSTSELDQKYSWFDPKIQNVSMIEKARYFNLLKSRGYSEDEIFQAIAYWIGPQPAEAIKALKTAADELLNPNKATVDQIIPPANNTGLLLAAGLAALTLLG